jgi:UDP-N-acetylmuramate dehydrogenase
MNRTDIFQNVDFKENEPLSKHSTIQIGGPAKYALFPKSSTELVSVINECNNKNIKYKVVGNASNILFDDRGFDGAVIFTSGIDDVEYTYKNEACRVKIGCGRSLTEIASQTGKKHCLSGLEFAYGIPGTVGGAVFMNAGAYGGQMSDVVVETEYFNTVTGEISSFSLQEHDFAYRHSIFQTHSEYIILSSTLELKPGDAEAIFTKMSQNMKSRKDKQPLDMPNAGSTFKRPATDVFVGKLIEDANLKGYTIGGAQISTKHAGFTVNCGNASAQDVRMLIDHVKDVILSKYNVALESEIIYVPYD